jgi:hypothetical protein
MNIKEEEQKSELDLLTILHFSLISLVVVHLLYFIYILFKQNCRFSASQAQKPDNLRKINDQCSICLENIQNEVQLLCSHSYCGQCLVDYFKQRYNTSDVQCPICRAESKFIFSNFERTETNKELYDYILDYNHTTTSNYTSSFCFCLDVFRLCQIYLRSLADFSNPRFRRHRTIVILLLLVVFTIVLWPFSSKITSVLEMTEDVIFYLSLIFACAEYFYRRFRRQTNDEFERIHSRQNTEEENNQSNIEIPQSLPSQNTQIIQNIEVPQGLSANNV